MNSNFDSRRALLRAGLALPILAGIQLPARAAGLPRQQIRVSAPFEMPLITVPDFSAARRFPITDFGAEQGDKDQPVKDVSLRDVVVTTVTGKPVQVENLEGFVNQASSA